MGTRITVDQTSAGGEENTVRVTQPLAAHYKYKLCYSFISTRLGSCGDWVEQTCGNGNRTNKPNLGDARLNTKSNCHPASESREHAIEKQ